MVGCAKTKSPAATAIPRWSRVTARRVKAPTLPLPRRVRAPAREASIKEWGWTTPALVGEDGGLIAGHARVLAARQLGIAEIPVMVAAGWTEAQKRAYVLADNQLAISGSGWDPDLLRLELGELPASPRVST